MRNLACALLVIAAAFTLSCMRVTEAQRSPGWRTNTAIHSIDLHELESGGPPKDGIPAIHDPKFVSVAEAHKWLRKNEPVIALEIETEARAYPLQILVWHEIVNDEIKSVPVAVSFCPLCYSALVFDRRIDGRTLSFGVTGMLRHSDMG